MRVFKFALTILFAQTLVPALAQGEDFVSYLLDLKYDSRSGGVYDTTNYHNPVLIYKNPEIVPQEQAHGIRFSFRMKGKEFLSIQRQFQEGQKWTVDNSIEKITYRGETSTALASLSVQPAPQSKAQLCRLSRNKVAFQKMLMTDTNRIYLENQGGLADIGVCWWYSRFERKAALLAYYSPDKRKPSRNAGIKLIRKIRTGFDLVEIPGYENLNQFTEDFNKEIQAALNAWQISDGIFGGGFIKGMSGSSKVSENELKWIMDQTYAQVMGQKKIAFQMLQIPGYSAHAWLVIGMKKTRDGYVLQTADSNYPSNTNLITYRKGMTHLEYLGREFVPYLHYDQEYNRLAAALDNACRN